MKFWLSVIFCLILAYFCQAQNGAPPSPGARGLAMGYTGLTFKDIHSGLRNPAGLAYLKNFSTSATAERRFLLNEIQTYTLAAAYPTSSGSFGMSLNYYGFEDYNEQRIGIAYARKLLDKLSIGAQFVLFNTQIPEYGNTFLYTFEVGILTQLFPELSLGIHVFSPIQIEIIENENIPTIFSLGFGYTPSDKVTVLAEVEKDIEFPARAKAGVEYAVVEAFALRVGVATNPTSPTFGVGYKLKQGLGIDVAASYHQILGFTPAFSLVYVPQ